MTSLGFRFDAELRRRRRLSRAIQLTHSRPEASIIFGVRRDCGRTGVGARPYMVVFDIEAARDDLVAEAWTCRDRTTMRVACSNTRGQVIGCRDRDPNRGDYASVRRPSPTRTVNAWVLQEVRQRRSRPADRSLEVGDPEHQPATTAPARIGRAARERRPQIFRLPLIRAPAPTRRRRRPATNDTAARPAPHR